ncbi:MAG TPA: dodecin [Candidatus Thermoplasmatota archaeon]|nr:dodecin [Candidatus Thermoplasmatota archaeon]
MTVYKMVEVVGTSNTTLSDAITSAVHRAGQTLDDLGWFEVKEIRGRIDEGEIAEYQVKVALGFRLHATTEEEEVTSVRNQVRTPTDRATRSREAQLATAAKRGGNRNTGNVDTRGKGGSTNRKTSPTTTRSRRAPRKNVD